MLFQEAVHRLTLAAQNIETAATSEWLPHLHHARSVFLELDQALDHESAPEMCADLHRLYAWCISNLIAAGSERSAAKVQDVVGVTVTLMEGWQAALAGVKAA